MKTQSPVLWLVCALILIVMHFILKDNEAYLADARSINTYANWPPIVDLTKLKK